MQKAARKKVLILGGSRRMVEVVETAKKLGVYTIVADHAIEAPAKKCADKSYDINPADIAKLVKMGGEERLDGVFAVFDDVTTWNALALCKRLDVPFYATKKQLASLPNQDKFLDYCKTFNVSVIDEITLAGQVEEVNGVVVEFQVMLNNYDGKRTEYVVI